MPGQLKMYTQNSLVSLMSNYLDSDDEEEFEKNIQDNISILNLSIPQPDTPSPGSCNSISNATNENHNMSNVPAENISFETTSELKVENDTLIPPEPPGACSLELQEKIRKLHQKVEAGQLDMNQWIQGRKDFQNPSICEKLIGFCNIDELGSNYPKDKFDPSQWPEDSYYDKLAEAQNEKMNKLFGKK